VTTVHAKPRQAAVRSPKPEPPPPDQAVSVLRRYAGWLDRNRASVAVRSHIEVLAQGVEDGRDVSLELRELSSAIDRLLDGNVRTLLRQAFKASAPGLSGVGERKPAQ
jgi:hypothetical protein